MFPNSTLLLATSCWCLACTISPTLTIPHNGPNTWNGHPSTDLMWTLPNKAFTWCRHSKHTMPGVAMYLHGLSLTHRVYEMCQAKICHNKPGQPLNCWMSKSYTQLEPKYQHTTLAIGTHTVLVSTVYLVWFLGLSLLQNSHKWQE